MSKRAPGRLTPWCMQVCAVRDVSAIPFLDWGRAHEFDGRCVEEAGSTRNASTAI